MAEEPSGRCTARSSVVRATAAIAGDLGSSPGCATFFGMPSALPEVEENIPRLRFLSEPLHVPYKVSPMD